ncbi:MAG: NUDIX hydrolase [Acidimicrobiales bacterium]
MTRDEHERRWPVVSRFVEVRSPWMSVIGERLQDETGKELDYWRVEKADSLLVIATQGDRLLLPKRAYRPGVGRVTLDLAGGRLKDPKLRSATAREIVRREFGLGGGDPFSSEQPLNDAGWDVDSSSSSQRLYGVLAELRPQVEIPVERVGASYPATRLGGEDLLRPQRARRSDALASLLSGEPLPGRLTCHA